MTDLYAELDIDRNADEDTIRRAYRVQAQRKHPDKGGDPAKFQRVQKAYDTLGNAEKRKRYDETGDAQETHQDPEADLRARLTSLLLQAMDGTDVEHTNILDAVRNGVRNGIAQLQSSRGQITEKLKKRERALKRLKRRGEKGALVLAMLGAELEKMSQALNALDEEVTRQRRLLALVDDYDYTVDPLPQAQQWPSYSDLSTQFNQPFRFQRGP